MIRLAKRLGWSLVALLNLLVPLGVTAQPSEPIAGVALELAAARAHNISHLRYDLALSIPDAHAKPVTGTNVLRFRLADPTKPLVIDFDAEGAPEASNLAYSRR